MNLSLNAPFTPSDKKFFDYKPSLSDIVRILLYPGNFFVRDPQRLFLDVSVYVYNEFTNYFKRTNQPIGIVTEIFKNRVNNKVWITIYNRFDGFEYSVPVHNVIEKI